MRDIKNILSCFLFLVLSHGQQRQHLAKQLLYSKGSTRFRGATAELALHQAFSHPHAGIRTTFPIHMQASGLRFPIACFCYDHPLLSERETESLKLYALYHLITVIAQQCPLGKRGRVRSLNRIFFGPFVCHCEVSFP